MKVAIIGGGASGMTAAYYLNKNGHQVTVFEKQAILGGHIRTLNKNVKLDNISPDLILEGGVVEFSSEFHHFLSLMNELEVELEPINVGSSIFNKELQRKDKALAETAALLVLREKFNAQWEDKEEE